MKKYYSRIFWRAADDALRQIGFESRQEIFRNLIVWSATVLILYKVSWARVPMIGTENPDVSSEVRLGLSALVAILILSSALFLAALARAPYLTFREIKAEADDLEKSLDLRVDEEKHRVLLSDLRKEAFAIYNQQFDPSNDAEFADWQASMETWADKVRAELKRHWSISALHDFDDPGSYGGWTKTMKNSEICKQIEARDRWLLPRYSSYFRNLDDLVRRGSRKFLGSGIVEKIKTEE